MGGKNGGEGGGRAGLVTETVDGMMPRRRSERTSNDVDDPEPPDQLPAARGGGDQLFSKHKFRHFRRIYSVQAISQERVLLDLDQG